ncbi:hypothetical protein Q7P37_000535 [Cladosporium fusiforme]
MPPTQGTGKAPNIANPNMPSASKKAPSVAGSTTTNNQTAAAAPESATAVAKDDPAKAIEKLETRTKAVNANNVARVANSQLTSSDEKLHPLVSLKTNKTLDRFPETSKDLAKLTLINVDNMLSALEADRTGNEASKREKLRVQIGLKPSPA